MSKGKNAGPKTESAELRRLLRTTIEGIVELAKRSKAGGPTSEARRVFLVLSGYLSTLGIIGYMYRCAGLLFVGEKQAALNSLEEYPPPF